MRVAVCLSGNEVFGPKLLVLVRRYHSNHADSIQDVLERTAVLAGKVCQRSQCRLSIYLVLRTK